MSIRLKISHVTAGAIAVLVGYTSSVAIIFQAIDALGATPAQAASWMMALGLGMGVTCILLSLRFKMPILTAWSTPGAALIAVGLDGVTMGEAIGAFLVCGALLTLTGLTGWFARFSRLIPDSIANALLAGILFQFSLAAFQALETDLSLVLVMTGCFLAGRVYFPRFAVPASFALGCIWIAGSGGFAGSSGMSVALSWPTFTAPDFSLQSIISLGLPLYIVTMCSQNMPGIMTLRAAGFPPPVSSSITVTGLTTCVLAPFGGFAFNLAAITAAICAGPEADEDPQTRYMAAVAAGVLYCFVGLGGAAVINLFLVAPPALVATIAGLALLGTVGNSLAQSLQTPAERDPALITFMITASGVTLAGIGAPLWALLAGVAVHRFLNLAHRQET